MMDFVQLIALLIESGINYPRKTAIALVIVILLTIGITLAIGID